MTFILKVDPKRASITFYYVIALNTKHKLKNTINRREAAQVLADLLQIDRSVPMSWLRGDFKKHPISRENFLRFVRAYRKKPGLESPKEINTLAINLYGRDYKRAIELLEPADRENNLVQAVPMTPPGKANLVTAICNLVESSTPEQVGSAWVTMRTYQWSARNSGRGNLLM
jgi:hypothetical protein